MRKEIIEVKCDRCGSLMEDPHTVEIKNAYGSALAIEKLTNQWNYVDLCPTCRDSFIRWWTRSAKNA